MIKNIYFTLLITACAPMAKAQLAETDKVQKQLSITAVDTSAWLHSGQFNVGISQGFLHNWASGGEVASLQANGIFTGNLTRINFNKLWTNDLLLAYGLNYIYSNKFVPRKVDDRIDFTSKYGIRSNKYKNWYLTALMNFRSQMTAGYDYNLPEWRSMPVSDFLSPGYLTMAIGLEYKRDDLSIFFSPAAARFTFANRRYTLMNPDGAFGIPYGETSRFELGAYLSARYKKDISKALTFRTRLDLYANYLAKDQYLNGVLVKKDNPGNVDVLFDNFFGLKVTKYIAVTLGITTIYDNDFPYRDTYTDPDTGIELKKDEPGTSLGWAQINQTLNIGFSYKF